MKLTVAVAQATPVVLDLAGHSSRPDLFDLRVRREPLVPFRPAGEHKS